MLPNDITVLMEAPLEFAEPQVRNTAFSPLKYYARGGRAIGDTSQGLNTTDWTFELTDTQLSANGVALFDIPTKDALYRISGAFDRNMQPQLTWLDTVTRQGTFRWWDTLTASYTLLHLAGVTDMVCFHDDVRDEAGASSDVILTYVRAGRVYYRQQRNRYMIEYEVAGLRRIRAINRVGMTKANRVMWECI